LHGFFDLAHGTLISRTVTTSPGKARRINS
jgi:hypothetical protein